LSKKAKPSTLTAMELGTKAYPAKFANSHNYCLLENCSCRGCQCSGHCGSSGL